jgi:hypothetical protein
MYLGGIESETSSEYSPTYTQRDINALSTAGSADILLTCMAPARIANLSSKPFNISGSKSIAELLVKVNPRYHFAAEGVFYEREPFENGKGYTRFLSLGNVKEERWFYAFKINVGQNTSEKPPPGVTANPIKKREFDVDDRACRICGNPSHLSYNCPQKPKKKRKKLLGRIFPTEILTDVNSERLLLLSIKR